MAATAADMPPPYQTFNSYAQAIADKTARHGLHVSPLPEIWVWLPALAAVGLDGVHIHDLRHTGNQFTADAGANTKELMARMGHDSERAALIYLHSSDKRQRALADAVGKAARAELARSKKAQGG
jgi:integrase